MKWKAIKETNGAYWVSEFGHIYRYAHCTIKKDSRIRGKHYKEGYVNIIKGRYEKVSLSGKDYYIHRLVAKTFLKTKEKPCVNHIDGDPHNNHYSNLEWVTHKENSRHASEHNLINKHSEKRKKQAPINAKTGGVKNRQYKHIGKVYEIDYKTNKIVKIYKDFYDVGRRCHHITSSRNRAVQRLEFGEVKRSGKIKTYYLWEKDYNKFKNKLYDN